MTKAVADYSRYGGPRVEYDTEDLCWYCRLPVVEASMGGTVCCPWCDCGRNRDGSEWTTAQFHERMRSYRAFRLAAAPGVTLVEGGEGR